MRYLNTILLVLILLVASGSAAYYYFFMSSQSPAYAQTTSSTPAAAPVSAPIFLALEPFTVTIQGHRSSQILYTEITLRLENIESHSLLNQYMPEVRNRVLAELAQHAAPELQTTDGRKLLTKRLHDVVGASYHAQLSGPHISSVLFTAFVIQ